ncbi:MAG: glutathione S-transferase family protein [Pseudomonadota bacterium]|nr:glutathione S-transferase family protein [Pseudomonadota bacterium]
MTAPLTFYTHPMSRGRTARWMLEETGLPYDTVLLDYGTTMKAPEYRAINPMGKVPAIRHGDVVVTEVAAIVMYLADLAPEKKLAPPAGAPERGAYYRWISFMAPLEQLMTTKASGGAMPDARMAGFGTEADLLDTLEGALKDRQHLAGDHFTAADLLVASFVGFYMQFKLLEARPAFTRFAELHQARPANLRSNEIDDKLMAEQQANRNA